MQVQVRLFALLRDRAGGESVMLDLPEGATVRDLKRELAARYPATAAVLPFCLVAVDREYARDEAVVDSTKEIALIPPVSGG